MRPMPAAPADMIADAISRNVRQRVIGRFDPRFTKFLKFLQIDVRQQLVPTRGNPRIVQLDQKAGVDDRLVFLLERLRYCVKVGFLTRVVLVAAVGLHGDRRSHRHERVRHPYASKRRLEIVDIDLEESQIVSDRSRAHPFRAHRTVRLRKAVILAIEVGKIPAVFAPRYAGLAGVARPSFKSAKPFIDISREARLAELSVADDVDADFGLPAHDLRYTLAQTLGKAFPVVGLVVYPGPHGVDNFHRACQAADVGREDSFRAMLHSYAFATASFKAAAPVTRVSSPL